MTLQLERLNENERATLRLILRGYDAKAIAREHDLSVHTVNERLRQARRKLGVSSSREDALALSRAEAADHNRVVHTGLGVAYTAPVSPSRSWHHGAFAALPAPRTLITGGIVMTIVLAATLLFFGAQSAHIAPPRDQSTLPVRTSAIEAAPLQAAQEWLSGIDGSHYPASWDAAGNQFRGQVTRAKWVEALTMVRMPLGQLQERKALDMAAASTLPGAPEGQYRILRFDARFDRRASAMETVVLCLEDGRWKVEAYLIQ